jgi:hypothetical protein
VISRVQELIVYRTEPLLLEHEFARDGYRRRVRVCLGFPRRVDAHEWACAFQVSGWRGGKILIADGVDGLQALTIAVSAIRTWLSKDEESSTQSTAL